MSEAGSEEERREREVVVGERAGSENSSGVYTYVI